MTFDNQKAEKKQLVRISYIISSVFFFFFCGNVHLLDTDTVCFIRLV